MKVKFIARQELGGSMEEFEDEAHVDPALGDLEAQVKEAVNRFNKEEKSMYGNKAKPREFIRLLDGKMSLEHEWHKKNIYGQRDRQGHIYDEWECDRCGLRLLNYGLGGPTPGHCYPERTCRKCQRLFKTVKNFERHERMIHATGEER